ncbi:hypothetical protein [Acinetobacter baumannii]|uniref:hypothetical protein n=1 Tax=Acinetobacter baumannii TaxID=470 RepID=UPI0034CE2717
MVGNDIHLGKINNIITHFIQAYEDEETLNRNDKVIARVFISTTINEKLFDEKRNITGPFPAPNHDSLLEHAISELCEKRDQPSIHNFIEKFVNLDSSRYRIEIPYEDITTYIYSYSGEINSEAVGERLDAFSNMLKDEVKILEEFEAVKVEKAYKKFVRHLKLAIAQKDYFVSINKEANKSAQLAQESATKALNLAGKANETLNTAKSTSAKAQEVAKNAQLLANEADAQAKSTIANYIAILGIFASIIFTLFGGVNLISATVKLLEANSRWPYLTFIIALLMICLLTLLNMLIKWVNSINNLKDELEKRGIQSTSQPIEINGNIFKKICGLDFYTKSVICFLAILLISLGGMYKIKKENFFSFSTETTSKHLEGNSNKNLRNTGDKLKNKNTDNIEKTVIEKYTVSNKAGNEKSEQKD